MTHFPPQPGEVMCFGCRFFQTDRDNPEAAMGRCMHPARHGYWYPGEWHRCEDHEAVSRRDE